MQDMLSETKAAAVLGISRPTLRKYRLQGLIPAVTISYAVFYSKVALENFKKRYVVRQGRRIVEVA